MNKRMTRLAIDLLIAALLTILINTIGIKMVNDNNILIFGLSIIPIIWISLRHGVPTGIITGFISGIISGGLEFGWNDFTKIILLTIIPLIVVAVAGFFAKYTQKTLNNRRLSSTYLNIFTGSFLAVFFSVILRYVILMPNFIEGKTITWSDGTLWINMVIVWLISSVLISLFAKIKPSLIIPKRSKFLSRKETSSLLND